MSKFFQTTIRIRTLLLIVSIALVLLGSGVFLTRAFWMEQLRAWARGAIDVASEKFVNDLPECDRVEVCRLAMDEERGKAAGSKRFEVWNFASPVMAEKMLTGQAAKEFCVKWRRLPCYWGWASLCHQPAYGFRFYQRGKLVFETSFCWKCSDFIVPTPFGHGFCGFDRHSTNSVVLWTLVQQHLPLPPTTNAPRPTVTK